ncbi:hypothetical protein HGA13_21455 [Nocardia speluncae]|uniref:Uncharacterized protein n=1 Tax=Nocardia speluncae TaxID=419477 RepID=A0A846XHJ0_9NOCA|nr:hypothetical protein [Nocardia speluncae]NKY35618.1 hypothetical protein [Nocardia speluncae]
MALTVTGAGIQFTRPRRKNLLFQIDFSDGDYFFNDGSPDYAKSSEYGVLPAGTLDQAIMDETRARLRAEGINSANAFRSILADAVRDTGKSTPLVGESVLSAVLVPDQKTIEVHFDLEDSITASIWKPSDSPEILHRLEVYTPFVILPSQIFLPSVASVGGWNVDGISLQFHGNIPDIGGGFMGAHPRKPPPKR